MQILPKQIIQNYLIILIFVSLNTGCSKTKNQETMLKSETLSETAVLDSTFLFNGKTLDGWKITQYGTDGPVLVSDGNLVLNYGDGCTGVNWEGDFPKVNYEVSLEAQRTVGNDFFCGITFPVNNEFCSLIVGGWGGPVVGISCIDGNDAEHNQIRVLKKFDKNRWYKIKLKVTGENITAWIDDEKLVDFNYSGHRLSVRAEVELSKPFGLFTWQTTGVMRNIRLEKF